jgi:sugar/nucleoside kinase (ribokinase family)
MIDVVVFGNATLDTLCYPVDDVPRHSSLPFERAIVAPGGCGSNVAIGLCALGVSAALVARIGTDNAAQLVEQYWERIGLDVRSVCRVSDAQTAVSVGLVDSDAQPRFIHTPGANATLTVDDLDVVAWAAEKARFLHVGGFLVLPGVSGERLAERLAEAQSLGVCTSLDVAVSRYTSNASDLWPCLPHVDFFFCNAREARFLTGETDLVEAVRTLRHRGADVVVLKLGVDGCRVVREDLSVQVPGVPAQVVDTTGAGDAFAAGFIAAMLKSEPVDPDARLISACRAGNEAGARVVGVFGAIEAWF